MDNERIQRLHKFMKDFKMFLRDNYYDIENKDIQWYLRGLVLFNVNELKARIMDCEKLYKDSLERAKKLHKDAITLQLEQDIKDYEYIFPELKESEDERIRKELIAYFEQFDNGELHGVDISDWIAWLEKQGEKKPTDKVESKFKVGDWIVDNCGYTWKIEGILNQFYILEGVEGGESRPTIEWVDKTYHLWTLKDAKDGDVLQLGEVTAIFKKYIGNENCTCYCSFCKAGGFEIPIAKEDDVYGCYDDTTPATKERRELLFQKMKEEGYEWDAEKKELKEIEQKPSTEMITPEESLGIDSETYNKIVDECIYGEQKSVWNEEDIFKVQRICKYLDEAKKYYADITEVRECIDWLKSFKDRVQLQWKPKDVHLEALRCVINGNNLDVIALKDLLEQLKKL